MEYDFVTHLFRVVTTTASIFAIYGLFYWLHNRPIKPSRSSNRRQRRVFAIEQLEERRMLAGMSIWNPDAISGNWVSDKWDTLAQPTSEQVAVVRSIASIFLTDGATTPSGLRVDQSGNLSLKLQNHEIGNLNNFVASIVPQRSNAAVPVTASFVLPVTNDITDRGSLVANKIFVGVEGMAQETGPQDAAIFRIAGFNVAGDSVVKASTNQLLVGGADDGRVWLSSTTLTVSGSGTYVGGASDVTNPNSSNPSLNTFIDVGAGAIFNTSGLVVGASNFAPDSVANQAGKESAVFVHGGKLNLNGPTLLGGTQTGDLSVSAGVVDASGADGQAVFVGLDRVRILALLDQDGQVYLGHAEDRSLGKGSLTVSGAFSLVKNIKLYVGSGDANGVVDVSNLSEIDAKSAVIGGSKYAQGEIDIDTATFTADSISINENGLLDLKQHATLKATTTINNAWNASIGEGSEVTANNLENKHNLRIYDQTAFHVEDTTNRAYIDLSGTAIPIFFGNFHQATSGTLSVNVLGTTRGQGYGGVTVLKEFDANGNVTNVGGSADLAGELDVQLTNQNGFLMAGQRFDIVTASTGVTGKFDKVTVIGLPNDLTYRMDYKTDPTKATLVIESKTGKPDMAIDGFQSTTDGKLAISYYLSDDIPTGKTFDVGIYRSANGTSTGVCLQKVTIGATEDQAEYLTAGQHTITITPNFQDVQQDYQLVAKVDASEEIAESDKTNNVMAFAGGIFLNGNELQVQGTSAADTLIVAPTYDGVTVYVTFNGEQTIFDTAQGAPTINAVHFRGHGGDDWAYSGISGWMFGGAGDDYLNAPSSYLDGGAGNNTLIGTSGGTFLAKDGNNAVDVGAGTNTIALGDGENDIATHGGTNDITVGGGHDSYHLAGTNFLHFQNLSTGNDYSKDVWFGTAAGDSAGVFLPGGSRWDVSSLAGTGNSKLSFLLNALGQAVVIKSGTGNASLDDYENFSGPINVVLAQGGLKVAAQEGSVWHLANNSGNPAYLQFPTENDPVTGAVTKLKINKTGAGTLAVGEVDNLSRPVAFVNAEGDSEFSDDLGTSSVQLVRVEAQAGQIKFNGAQHLAALKIDSGATVELAGTAAAYVTQTYAVANAGTLRVTGTHRRVGDITGSGAITVASAASFTAGNISGDATITISGTATLGDITGAGTTTVNASGNLTAGNLVGQTAITIDGTAGVGNIDGVAQGTTPTGCSVGTITVGVNSGVGDLIANRIIADSLSIGMVNEVSHYSKVTINATSPYDYVGPSYHFDEDLQDYVLTDPGVVPTGLKDGTCILRSLTIANDGAGLVSSPTASSNYFGTLDLKNNNLAINYTGDPNNPSDPTSLLSQVRDAIRSAYNGGNWDGRGLTSSLIAAHPEGQFALGFSENNDANTYVALNASTALFEGAAVNAQSVLIKFTWQDDLNLDGVTDITDASAFGNNFDFGATSGHTFAQGDLNYDGVIDITDSAIFGNAFITGLTPLPEPSSFLLAGLGLLGLLFARRRKGR